VADISSDSCRSSLRGRRRPKQPRYFRSRQALGDSFPLDPDYVAHAHHAANDAARGYLSRSQGSESNIHGKRRRSGKKTLLLLGIIHEKYARIKNRGPCRMRGDLGVMARNRKGSK
jgi:hypothetical protein